jgi:hypothetical protein
MQTPPDVKYGERYDEKMNCTLPAAIPEKPERQNMPGNSAKGGCRRMGNNQL